MQTKQTHAPSTDLIHASLHHPIALSHQYQLHTMPPPRLSSALLRARPQARYQCLSRIAPLRRASTTPPHHNDIKPVVPWKTPTSVWSPENLIPPPKDGEILLERRPNRALPPYVESTSLFYSTSPTRAGHCNCRERRQKEGISSKSMLTSWIIQRPTIDIPTSHTHIPHLHHRNDSLAPRLLQLPKARVLSRNVYAVRSAHQSARARAARR